MTGYQPIRDHYLLTRFLITTRVSRLMSVAAWMPIIAKFSFDILSHTVLGILPVSWKLPGSITLFTTGVTIIIPLLGPLI